MTAYTDEDIKRMKEALRALPSKERVQSKSKQDVITALKSEITILQKRGYSLGQIAESLGGLGMDISTPTLKTYLQRTRPAKEDTAKVTKDTPPRPPAMTLKATPEVTPEAGVRFASKLKPDPQNV